MDQRTSRKMTMIGANMPREILRNMVVKERPYAEVRNRLEAAASDPRLNRATREEIRKTLGNEMVAKTLDREVSRIDHAKAEEARRYVDTKVDQYIERNGKADMSEYKSFLKRVNN